MKHHLLMVGALWLASGSAALSASLCPPGFDLLQNSDTCVRVSGRVRAETILGSSHRQSSDTTRMRTTGEVRLDVRKPTEYGPLRAVIGVKGVNRLN
ncbi:porin [Microvirga sp. P5_D2]